MCNGKARRACDKTQHTLSIKIIDLIDHTIDVIGQIGTPRAHLFVIAQQVSSALRHHMLRYVHG